MSERVALRPVFDAGLAMCGCMSCGVTRTDLTAGEGIVWLQQEHRLECRPQSAHGSVERFHEGCRCGVCATQDDRRRDQWHRSHYDRSIR